MTNETSTPVSGRTVAGRSVGLIRTLFPVERGERVLALVLYTILMLMVRSDWVGKVGADSLFVKRFGVRYIPLMSVLTPIVTLTISALLYGVLNRFSGRALLFGYIAAVIVGLWRSRRSCRWVA
jgi:hypothetical protein